ncbi:MAG: OmpH family outer membrane protein [Bacteroidota bacterium]|nr:OmpH family outer membrane protein [Bacteroidota bacterium]
MKKSTLIPQIILAIAIIVLYILHFTQDNSTATNDKTKKRSIVTDTTEQNIRIAYVNTDSILHNYKYYNALEKKLEIKQNNASYQLKQKTKKLEKDYKNLLSKINLGLITEEQAQQQFAKQQQGVEQYRATVRNDLLIEEQKLTEELYDSIVSYIERYNQQTNYNYILGYSKGSGILHADKKYNLTSEVLFGLNEEYDNRTNTESKKKK